MQQNLYFETRKTASYSQLGEINSNTKELWFVLHGYGQLAKYFIRKFQPIATEERVIVAPEGLSRFYNEGFNGRVGATWMTKEERELDIQDYISYLNDLFDHITKEYEVEKVILLGFSQGGATVSRWATSNHVPYRHLVLWSSILPPDLDASAFQSLLQKSNTTILYGDEDPFLNADREREFDNLSNLDGVSKINFKGGHDIDQEILKRLTKTL